MLELDDIQHFLLTRPPALAARYEFVSFRERATGPSVARRTSSTRSARGGSVPLGAPPDSRWVTIAFTWNGLRALGVDEASLATFPEEFRQGMVARAEVLGDTGANHPDQLGRRAGQRQTFTPSSSCSRATSREREAVRRRVRAICVRVPRRGADLDARPGGDTAVRLRARSLRLPRSTVAAGDRGHRRRADAGLGAALKPESSSSATRRGRRGSDRCRSRRSCRATAAFSPTDGSRSTSARSATSCGSMARHRRSRS